jgi:predicted CoA-binding protein
MRRTIATPHCVTFIVPGSGLHLISKPDHCAFWASRQSGLNRNSTRLTPNLSRNFLGHVCRTSHQVLFEQVICRRWYSYPIQIRYLSNPGASQDPKKYGNIILKWYLNHNLPVHPINPTATTIESLPVKKNISSLDSPAMTSLSFLTPPQVTRVSLKEALEGGVQRVWLQPGSFDKELLEEAENMGFETVIASGRCILIEGEKGLNASKRASKA